MKQRQKKDILFMMYYGCEVLLFTLQQYINWLCRYQGERTEHAEPTFLSVVGGFTVRQSRNYIQNYT